jgi:hypothetical protein
MHSRGTATDRLADVIQTLQIAHKTGFLTANRDDMGQAPEQGIITFQSGRIIDASVGSDRGERALSKIMTWRKCYFIFQISSHDMTSRNSTIPSNNSIAKGYKPEKEVSNTSIPKFGIPYRTQQGNEALPYFSSLGLSRMHRQLFLLVDGKRSERELMQLTNRRLEEIDTLLTDLERVGLIRR